MNPLADALNDIADSDLIEGLEAARDDLHEQGLYDPLSFLVAALIDQAITRLRARPA